MKKVISLILISVMIIAFSTNIYATGVLDDDNTTTITGNEYQNAQKNNETNLPQTGVENFGLGILLVICVGTAIFAYKKVNEYKGI